LGIVPFIIEIGFDFDDVALSVTAQVAADVRRAQLCTRSQISAD